MTDYSGRKFEMPVLLEWELCYGDGLPCDSFEVCYAYDEGMLEALTGAVRFTAIHEGRTVFYGVVDEFEVRCDDEGKTVQLSGRSLAARLLDNEAAAAEYWSVGLQSVLDSYVYSCGLEAVRVNTKVPNQALTVASGTSCYRALEDFLWYGARLRPRFAPDGTLLIGEDVARRLSIGADCGVSARSYRLRRYGVLSQVVVKSKSGGTQSIVENGDFAARGGSCRRIVNVPRKTRYDTMRATGEYQIACSKAEELRLAVTVPGLFAAFPGDVVELGSGIIGAGGCYIVGRTRCFATGYDAGTEIIMTSREA